MGEQDQQSEKTDVENTPVTPAAQEPLPEGATRQPTPEDPEGDGLTKGQATASVPGDILDI